MYIPRKITDLDTVLDRVSMDDLCKWVKNCEDSGFDDESNRVPIMQIGFGYITVEDAKEIIENQKN